MEITTENGLYEKIRHLQNNNVPLDPASINGSEHKYLYDLAKKLLRSRYGNFFWKTAVKNATLAECIESEEKRLLQKLKSNPKAREKFCEDFHQKIVERGFEFPNSIVPALDHLIANIDVDRPRKKGVLVSGKYLSKTQIGWSSNEKHRYPQHNVSIAGERFYLFNTHDEEPQRLECLVEIAPEGSDSLGYARVTSGLYQPGWQNSKKVVELRSKEGIFCYEGLTKKQYKNCFGIEIRNIGKERKIKLFERARRASAEDGKKNIIMVSKRYKKKPIISKFQGQYVFFYDEQETPVNAHRVRNLGFECGRLRPVPQNIEYIRLKNINLQRLDITFYTTDRICIFRPSSILETAGMDLEGKTCALMCHNKGHGYHDDFYLLVRTENGEVLQKGIMPNCQRGKTARRMQVALTATS